MPDLRSFGESSVLNQRTTMKARWPWNVVKSFEVHSLANGNLTIKPVYWNPYKGPEEGGGPGLLTRMALAEWAEKRLSKRAAVTTSEESP